MDNSGATITCAAEDRVNGHGVRDGDDAGECGTRQNALLSSFSPKINISVRSLFENV